MVLGQSASTAAALAIDAEVSVQAVDYARLREQLLADQQVLEWTGPRPNQATQIDPAKLPGIVVDDREAEREGFESLSTSIGPHVAVAYRHDGDTDKGRQTIRFPVTFPAAGEYEVRLAYTANANRATNVPVTINSSEGKKTITVNQREAAPIDKAFFSLGTFTFDKEGGWVELSNEGTDGYVIADAVWCVRVKD